MIEPEKINIALLKQNTNCCIVQLSNRRFPGIVLQGDTLSSWISLIDLVTKLIEEGDINEALDTSKELKEKLEPYQMVYENFLKEKNIPFPYVK